MKKLLLLFISSVVLLSSVLAGTQTNSSVSSLSGSGTEGDPYLISSVSDLAFFRNEVNLQNATYNALTVYVQLAADLDLGATTTATAWVPIGSLTTTKFKGIFNGNNKTISNLTIGTVSSKANQNPSSGLFGSVDDGAVIKNLTLSNLSFYLERTSSGNLFIGGLAGHISAGNLIENCHVSGTINLIHNTTGVVTNEMEVGALVGRIQNGTGTGTATNIINCSTNVNISVINSGTSTGDIYIGGVAGYFLQQGGTMPQIINSYAKGTIYGEGLLAQRVYIGGIAGMNSPHLYNCYASGDLEGKSVTGNISVCGIASYRNTANINTVAALMNNITTTTTSGTVVTRRIVNGLGTGPVNLELYANTNLRMNGSITSTGSAFYGSDKSSGADLAGNASILLNVAVGPSVSGVTPKTWVTINASSNDASKGSVSGATTAFANQSVTLSASAIGGNNFTRWTESSVEVSTDASYTLSSATDKTLVAVFDVATALVNPMDSKSYFTKVGKTIVFDSKVGAVYVFNTTGVLVASSKTHIDALELKTSGIYMVKMVTPEGIKTVKVVL